MLFGAALLFVAIMTFLAFLDPHRLFADLLLVLPRTPCLWFEVLCCHANRTLLNKLRHPLPCEWCGERWLHWRQRSRFSIGQRQNLLKRISSQSGNRASALGDGKQSDATQLWWQVNIPAEGIIILIMPVCLPCLKKFEVRSGRYDDQRWIFERQIKKRGWFSSQADECRTRDIGRAMRLSSALEFDTVWINDHLPLTSETPHGGFKQSGFGKDLSAEAIGDYQVTKHVMIAHKK